MYKEDIALYVIYMVGLTLLSGFIFGVVQLF